MQKILTKVNKFLVIVFVFCVFYYGVLYASFYYLDKHYQEISVTYNDLSKDAKNYTNTIADINEKITYIKGIQKDNFNLSRVLQDFATIDNPSIKLDQISIDTERKLINISGEAKTREMLLIYQDNLESIPYLSDVNLPISSLVEKNDIKFNLNITFKLDEFAKN